MNRLRLSGLRLASALTLPLLWLLASGCRSVENASPERSAGATAAQVSSTNPVPVEMEDEHLLVRGALNGREVRFVLDTGASHVLVSPAAAAAAGIQTQAKIRRFGAFGSGRGSARKGIADSMAVGPAAAEKVPIAIMDLPPPFTDDGLLGLSFLSQFTFRLDYQHQLVSFALTASSNLMGGGSMIPLQGEGFFAAVEAEVDGIPAKLILDTGAGRALILRSWFVEKQRLRERYPNRLSMLTGLGLLGRTHGEVARLQTLKLGDYTLTNLFAEFESTANTWPGDIAGFVGAPILRRFNLTFDLAGRRLWIEPNADYATESPPPASVRSGFVCLPEGTNWIVQDLVAGSPATESGVRLGDRLLEINGELVQSMKPGEIKRAFRAGPGTHVRLRVQTRMETPREATLILRDLL
jgi:clan AA aspartic protease (TIGR02281 family)